MISIGNFTKRVNRDSTIDLICTRCFLTAARGRSDAEAMAIAQQHVCHTSLQESEERYDDSQRGTS